MGDARPIGADLRSLRKSRGLTLESVAAHLGKSVGWLSQVERDISQVEPAEVAALARLLGVPVSLFAGPETPKAEAGRIVRKDARRAIGERAPGLVEELLSPDLTDSFEVIHSTFLPGAAKPDAVERPTAELAVIVAGRLDVWLGEDRFTVAAGDSFRVRGEPMRWANPYDTPAVAVWVISPPVY
ncbi:MAG: XRE family transcriptional regulator [Rhodobacter sp.]|nr:XRE family transcriptional regulator [Rhodobacter sp.]